MARTSKSKTGTPDAQAQSDRVTDTDEQPKGPIGPNGDELAVDSPDIDSAGEQKARSERDGSETNEAVVTAAVQQQTSVGAPVAEEETSISKQEQAESPVSLPNGARSNTFTTPPRVAVDGPQQDADGNVPAEPKTVDGVPVAAAGQPIALNETAAPHNGVVHPPNPENGGIIPDASHAETDGTVLPGGGPNEALNGQLAPAGDYVGEDTNTIQHPELAEGHEVKTRGDQVAHTELRTAPISQPVGRNRNEATGNSDARPGVHDTGVALAGAASRAGVLVDAKTDEAPDAETLFENMPGGSEMRRCTVRLIQLDKARGTRVLLLPKGAQVGMAQAERIKARVQAQRA